jgi:hypothetical protein
MVGHSARSFDRGASGRRSPSVYQARDQAEPRAPAAQLAGDLDNVTADRAREALSATRETRQERRGRRLEIANCPPIMPQWFFTRDPGVPDGVGHELARQQQRNLDEHRVMAFLRQPGGDGAASPWRHALGRQRS